MFLEKENSDVQRNVVLRAYTFNVEGESIKNMKSEILTTNDMNYVFLWLLSKQIEILYIKGIDETAKHLLEKINIKLKSVDEVKDHPLLRLLLQ